MGASGGRSEVPVDSLFGLDRIGEPGPAGAERPAPVATRLLDVGEVERDGLDRVLADLPPSVLRAKGLVTVGDVVHEVHVVGPRRHVRPRPDLDASAADGRLVVIELAGRIDHVD